MQNKVLLFCTYTSGKGFDASELRRGEKKLWAGGSHLQ